MSYLLDTDVISELTRPRPHPGVLAWVEALPVTSSHLSVLTVGEIRSGVERLRDRARRERLRRWLEHELPAWFGGRLLPVSAEIADRWGRLVAEVGRPVPVIDSLLAATALQHDLRLVTRNRVDFRFPGLEVVDPWSRSG